MGLGNNQVDILPYLPDVLNRLPTIVPEYLPRGPANSPFETLAADQLSALRSLLPDRWLRDHPEHLLAHRAEELAADVAPIAEPLPRRNSPVSCDVV